MNIEVDELLKKLLFMHHWKNIVEELGIIEELLYNNYSQRIVMEIYYWENAVEKLPLPTKTCGRWVTARTIHVPVKITIGMLRTIEELA
jgi:hypothetical protein